MAIEALYRTIRSDARQLARRDSLAVIWAYSQFLQVNDFQMPQYIEVAQHRDPDGSIIPLGKVLA
jgi:hypothetical protein